MKSMNSLFRHARPIAVVGCAIFLAGTIVSHQARAQSSAAQNSGTAAQSTAASQTSPSPSSTAKSSSAAPAKSAAASSEDSLEAQFPDGEGKQTFLTTCSKCHSPERVIGKGQDANGWTNVVLQMIQNGAQGSNEQFGAIVYYLSKHFGPPPTTVNVNAASRMDFRNWLYFTEKQADAIVDYRTKHGDFKTIADLEKVPGIDPKMIQSDKSQLTFGPSAPAPKSKPSSSSTSSSSEGAEGAGN